MGGRSRGFTIVEVLVALMIMAVMAAMVWQGLDGILRSRNSTQERLEQTLRRNTVLAQWEQDLASVQESTAVPGIAFDGASLRLTRRAPQGLQLVTWSLRPLGNHAALYRFTGPVARTAGELQEAWLASQQLQGLEAGQLRMVDGLSQWQVYFYRDNAWTNAQSSGNLVAALAPTPGASAPALRQSLPDGVRLVLTFADGGTSTLTRDIALAP